MSSEVAASIEAAFKEAGLTAIDSEVLGKCSAFANNFRIPPQELAESWEAYSLNKNIQKLDKVSYDNFRKHVVKERELDGNRLDEGGAVFTSSKRRTDATAVITPASNKRQQHLPLASNMVSTTLSNRMPLSPEAPVFEETTTKKPAFKERTESGKVIASFNPKNLPAPAPQPAGASLRCTVSFNQYETNVKAPYRHMFTTMEERSRQLDRMIQEKEQLYEERYDFGSENFAKLEAVGVPCQETAHEGRMNATSVMLEGSRHTSNGSRVEVDLSNVKAAKESYSLFPGQIVAIEGVNTSGRKLVAQRICEGAARTPEPSSARELLKLHHDVQGGSPLQLLTACGPFTSSDNLEYEPLYEFMVKVKEHEPDVVILMGPFVDMRHKRVSTGRTTLEDEDGNEVVVPCEVLFMNKVSLLLEEFYEVNPASRTHFVIVPSMEDASASWVYPQAPLRDHRDGDDTQLDIPGSEGIEVGTLGLSGVGINDEGVARVHCVPNPCTLRINDIAVGVTSADVLFNLSSAETNANLEVGSRLARLGQHLLQQQSYYPLYPASPKTNLNLKFMDQWKIPCSLDFLILPSKLFPFARSVLNNTTIVVNPGLLTKDTVGGTYSIIDIHPIDRTSLEDLGVSDVTIENQIVDRSVIEIRKI